ncbi:MAG: hypothetical protein FWJ66_07660 [Caldibacillus sp.]
MSKQKKEFEQVIQLRDVKPIDSKCGQNLQTATYSVQHLTKDIETNAVNMGRIVSPLSGSTRNLNKISKRTDEQDDFLSEVVAEAS